MIRPDDLREAIAECQGERNPNANTCMKLAAYYTILRELEGDKAPSYSYDNAPVSTPSGQIVYSSTTDFGRAIEGKNEESAWALVDELITILQVVQPKMYSGFMRKLDEL